MNFKENLLTYLDEEFVDDLLESMQKERTNCLILNTQKMNDETFLKMFPKVIPHDIIPHAFFYDKNDYDFGKSFYFDNGLYYIMDSASMMVPFLLPVEDNDYVLDMCAAPGGKSIFLSLKNPNINIISNDINYQRSCTLSSNIEKMGLSNEIVSCTTISLLVNYYKSTFDKIVLDAPCSGSAMFRKSEEMKNDWNYNKVLKCQALQKELIEQAAIMLKDGGLLSYSTCSFSYEENEGVILDFLSKHNEFKPIKIMENPSFVRGKNLSESIHLFPNKYKGEGQFICLLKKDGKLVKKDDHIKPNEFKYKEKIKDDVYLYNNCLKLNHLTILRKGLLKSTFKGKNEIPSFHFAHYLNSKNSIKLTEDEAKKYLHGDEITKITNLSNGYYVVSYQDINLGYVHIVDNKLKNLYPKGLRH